MHSLEPELRQLHSDGMLDDQALQRAVLLERGSVFSVFLELRIALFLAVAMIIAGVGLFLREHLDRIGPLTIMLGLLLIALVCYGSAIRSLRLKRERSLSGDYVLLLGALVFSADVGYAESQFHLLGEHWLLHLLLLAAWHGVTAYVFHSRLVLSVALTSLAAWFGIEPTLGQMFAWDEGSVSWGISALNCAAVLLLWHVLHRRFAALPAFLPVLEHFIINTAFWGALAFSFAPAWRWPGLLLVLGIAAYIIPRGLRQREEALVVYGIAYATLAACVVMSDVLGDGLSAAIAVLVLVITATALLWRWHQQLKVEPI